MRVDLYHLYRGVHFSRVIYPIFLDVLKVWGRALGWETRLSVARESAVDLDTSAEVVGISVYTQTAPAAYRVSDELRPRGKIVVLGGPHFRGSSTLEEAAPHCDVIAPSICEEQWHDLLRDVASARLQPGREKPLLVSDRDNRFRYPRNFFQALETRRWYQIPTIPTSLGCPYHCGFCAPHMQGQYRPRDVDTIVAEAARAPGRVLILCDATFGLNRKFTIQLMQALAPLGKHIGLETTLARLDDREVLNAMALGGVKWCVVGVETLGLKLDKHGSVDLEAGLRRIVDRAHGLGMIIQGNFICGLDCDGPDSFDRTFEYYVRSNLDAITFGILTPYPDTPLYQQLERQGRIFDTNWEDYDGNHVVYIPKRMTIDQLIDGYLRLYRNVRRYKSALRETVAALRTYGFASQTAALLGNNLYWKLDSMKQARLLRRNQREIAALDLPPWDAEDKGLHTAMAPNESSARAAVPVLATPGAESNPR